MLSEQAIEELFGRFEAREPEENQAERKTRQVAYKIKERAFKSLVAVILSAQSHDEMTARASRKLFAVADTPEAIAALPDERLQELIRDCGLYRNKARSLKRLSAAMIERGEAELPDTREGLMELPGIGRKSADIILRFHFGRPVCPVDTHVFRVS